MSAAPRNTREQGVPNREISVEREHGTAKGYRQHRYRMERPCAACKVANTAASTGRAQARYAALVALAKKYRAEYLALYAAEKTKRGI